MTRAEALHFMGLPATASESATRKRYLSLSLLYHPDQNGGHDLKFKELAAAYRDTKQIEDFQTWTVEEWMRSTTATAQPETYCQYQGREGTSSYLALGLLVFKSFACLMAVNVVLTFVAILFGAK